MFGIDLFVVRGFVDESVWRNGEFVVSIVGY